METSLPIINNEENNNTEKKKKRGEVIESKFNELIDINKNLATGFMNFSDKFENIMVKPEPKEKPKKKPMKIHSQLKVSHSSTVYCADIRC